ncbi:hypothetical protein HZC09_01420 [Candidatus Micrarchaeota archaeon]|nr:hypothetical protein [Candidatus Micrarchaeota archaeon]
MEYYDWNTQAPEKSEALGWKAFKAQKIILKNNSQLKGLPPVCSVCSASSELLRLACRKTKIVDPTMIRGFERDVGLAREATERGAYFEIPLKPILRETGERRARTMQCYREFLALCIKHNARFVYSSQAETNEDVKSVFEAEILLQQLGLTKEHAKAMIKRKVE